MTTPQSDGGPEEPMTVLMQNAVATHELYEAYIKAGFEEDVALKLILGQMSFFIGREMEA